MPAVTMFSLVEVGSRDDERFIKFFKEVRDYFSQQPGFITNQLYRSKTPISDRRFMVVGKWESIEAFQAATMTEGWNQLMSGRKMVLSPVPYEEVLIE
jgi:heme-degrading monooxygenase HmoA